jgi:hypothetical protein
MAGVWHFEQNDRTVQVQIDPFAKLPRWTRPLMAAEAERLAEFLGRELRLRIGP